MRHTLQGFTMHIDGLDFGLDTEEVDLPIPTPKTEEYLGGGVDLTVDQPMGALDALSATVKMAGSNPEVLKRMGLGPGVTTRLTFRAAVLRQMDGGIATHVCIVQGCMNGGSRDRWQRGTKSGLEFIVNGIQYLRYEVDAEVIHEVQMYPPKRIINGVDQLAGINAALGYA